MEYWVCSSCVVEVVSGLDVGLGGSGEVGAVVGGTTRRRERSGMGNWGGRSAVGKEGGGAGFVCAGKWGKLSGKGGIWGKRKGYKVVRRSLGCRLY